MTAEGAPPLGSIARSDLTVPAAAPVRDFSTAVVGWRPEPVEMGGYRDFTMLASAGDTPVAGICHSRGGTADRPPQWLPYIVVGNLAAR